MNSLEKMVYGKIGIAARSLYRTFSDSLTTCSDVELQRLSYKLSAAKIIKLKARHSPREKVMQSIETMIAEKDQEMKYLEEEKWAYKIPLIGEMLEAKSDVLYEKRAVEVYALEDMLACLRSDPDKPVAEALGDYEKEIRQEIRYYMKV